MPPKKTFSWLTFGSSVSVGVYNGTSVTSCPWRSISVASALSRRQEPQYIPAAPAVICRIFTMLPGRPSARTDVRTGCLRAADPS